MEYETPTPWRCDARFLLRGSLLSVLFGLAVGALLQLGGPSFEPIQLFLSALIAFCMFLVATALLVLFLRRIQAWGKIGRAMGLAALFFVAGVSAWILVHLLLDLVQGGHLLVSWTWERLAGSIVINGALAILIGSAFFLYEVMRQRLLESTSRLKEAEFAEKELALARSIQERLLPATELEGDGYRVAVRNVPAQYVAGDFYDIFSLPDGGLGLVVADVAGKGIGSSLIMASVKAVLPLLAAERTVEATLKALNGKLFEELERRQFVALCYARFEPGNGELVLGNAGIPDPYLLRPGEAPSALSVPGPRLPLGLRSEQDYCTLRVALRPADRLLILTDGLPEARTAADEPLGYEALTALFPPSSATPGAWLDDLLRNLRHTATGEIDDDRTALLLERTESESIVAPKGNRHVEPPEAT
jgi:serine phosphatase RsbU (regulator of sigma subunit)